MLLVGHCCNCLESSTVIYSISVKILRLNIVFDSFISSPDDRITYVSQSDVHQVVFIRLTYAMLFQLTSSGTSIMSSCVRPMVQGNTDPIVLLHGFDR